jgi:hypothetical protein
MLTVSWFSSGVSSAVATKLFIDRIDKIFYIHINDQHEDTLRFVSDCEAWFGKEITVLYPSQYRAVDSVCRATRYVNGPRGAPCTRILKKRVRKEFERLQAERLTYVWGMDCSNREKARADGLISSMPEFAHTFPLIERGITKEAAHKILKASGISRPKMYELGYPNNNCVGCVKGGMGYWNKIRKDFPRVFESRALMERDIGASCINGVFLDELSEDSGRDIPVIVDDCGIMCEIIGMK